MDTVAAAFAIESLSWHCCAQGTEACAYLDVPVEDAFAVAMRHGLQDLPSVDFDQTRVQKAPPPADELVHIEAQQLKHERKAASGLVIQHLLQRDHVGMRRQAAQCLNFPQVVDRVQALKGLLHALDGAQVASLHTRVRRGALATAR